MASQPLSVFLWVVLYLKNLLWTMSLRLNAILVWRLRFSHFFSWSEARSSGLQQEDTLVLGLLVSTSVLWDEGSEGEIQLHPFGYFGDILTLF